MIEIFRAKNPEVFVHISRKLHHFKDITDESATLKKMLFKFAKYPEATNVQVMFEDNELKMFLFGYLQDEYGWIDYAWTDNDVSIMYRREIIDRFLDWCQEQGKTQVRLQTEASSADAWKQQYKFSDCGVVLKIDLDETWKRVSSKVVDKQPLTSQPD
jgi:hypothetical protein